MSMGKIMVLGASGGMGLGLVEELLGRELPVVAVSHSEAGMERLCTLAASKPKNLLEVVRCDANDGERLQQFARGCDIIFNSINLPFSKWDQWPPLLEKVILAAQFAGARLVHIDNVYAYGYAQTETVDENHPKQPHTHKGKIRLQLEERLLKAHADGVPSLIVHYPDFYGATARHSMLDGTLRGLAKGKKAMFVGNTDVKREYIYIPDGAKAAVELALRDDAYGENWHVPGAGTISGREIAAIAAEITGLPGRLSPVGRGMISMVSLFNRDMRGVVEMFYLTERPLVLNGSKYESRIGKLPRTDYRTGIAETLLAFGVKTQV